jgi:hypothetical protein
MSSTVTATMHMITVEYTEFSNGRPRLKTIPSPDLGHGRPSIKNKNSTAEWKTMQQVAAIITSSSHT